MILVRPVSRDVDADLELAFVRMALPASAREFLLEKIPQMHLMVTGISRDEGRFLRCLPEQMTTPGREDYPAYVPADVQRRPGTALLSGRKDQLERLVALLRQQGSQPFAEALERGISGAAVPPPTHVGSHVFDFGGAPQVMGILNMTPDSFSDGGRFSSNEDAVGHALAMVEQGAAIIDVGGESTRPGAKPVSVPEELGRVVPVIEALRKRADIAISIDTRKSDVARAALSAGAVFVNDVTGFTHDPMLAQVTAEHGAACCVMHLQGTPETMQAGPHYGDVMEDVLQFLAAAIDRGVAAGIPRARIWVDPGIGFGKTLAHNLLLLRRSRELRILGQPILFGVSRKNMLGALTGNKPPHARMPATLACIAALTASGGVDIVRVHDVAEVRDAIQVVHAIRTGADGGDLYRR